MKKWRTPPDEFYVGYFAEAPTQTAAFIRKVIITLGILIVLVSILLVYNQRMFSNANFEYGKLTTVEGYLFQSPIPHLKVVTEKDSVISSQTLLLVGFGKAGADETIKKFETTIGNLDGKRIVLSGYRIYGNGKALLQISADKIPTILEQEQAMNRASLTSLGVASFTGEIVDPKCYFGVMKPGEGKPHRSCAIRCIAGGIPPVLHTDSEFLIILGEDLQPVNTEILSMVGDRIELTGEVATLDDWKVLLINRRNLVNLSFLKKIERNILAMESNMTICKNNY